MDSMNDHNWRKYMAKIDQLKKDAVWSKKKMDELKIPDNVEFSNKINELQQKLNDLIPKLDDLIKTMTNIEMEETKSFEELKLKEKELHLEIEKQRSEIQELRKKIRILEDEKRKVELGQATWLFEQYIAHFVLPETEKIGFLGCFKHMKKWLKDNDLTPEGAKRQSIWTDLQSNSNVTWSTDHWNAIKNLRELRKPLAHPPKVNLTQAKQEIANTMPNLEHECLDIINMVDKLNSLMVLGKLACEFEDKVIHDVYPGAKMDNAGLMNWIEVNGASERWMELNNGIEWTKKHEETLAVMKSLKRNVKDLQEVELDTAKMHLIDYVPKTLEKECFEIVDMMKRLNP